MKLIPYQVAYSLALTKHTNDRGRVIVIVYPLLVLTGLIFFLTTTLPRVRAIISENVYIKVSCILFVSVRWGVL